MDYDPEIENGGHMKKEDKEPMYKSLPEDSAPVARRTFLITVGLIALAAAVLLIVVVMCLNGTIVPVNDRFFVRKPNMDGKMDTYAVVGHTFLPCSDDLPMKISKLNLAPHPLVLPDRAFNTTYELEMMADMPVEGMHVDVLVQHLGPPWYRVPCVNGKGSCFYEQGCDMIEKMFNKKCSEMTKGNHGETVISDRMVDMQGPLGWIKPGNYMARVKITYREEDFGCGFLSFRVTSR